MHKYLSKTADKDDVLNPFREIENITMPLSFVML